MKKNIVLIQTVENVGTGIIYPCHYDKSSFETNSFIIFTNRHVLNDIEDECEEGKDLKKNIILQIFDDDENLIEEKSIKRVEVFMNISHMDYYNDIAAILVLITKDISLTLETKIYQDEVEDRDTIYMEGYPGVMLDDEINQKVQLEGRTKNIFPSNKYMGVYQIVDDYHWYNNYKDYKLMQGFSGSPVYKESEKETFLIGMNQSTANIENGENPFKLVYYLRMEYVFNYLRENGCIIYGRKDKYTYNIEWIYGLHKEIENYNNKPTFLLIGGSGAGKSSFARDFALHGDCLNSVNDGQTTRTNVVYNFNIFSEKNEAEIELINKKDFLLKMKKLNGIKPILFVYYKLFNFKNYNSDDAGTIYLENTYYLTRNILYKNKLKLKSEKWNRLLVWMDEFFLQRKNFDIKKLKYIYLRILELLIEYIPINQIKFICDKEAILKVHEKVLQKSKYNKFFTDNEETNKMSEFKSILNEIFGDEIDKNIEEILFTKCREKEFDYKDYQIKCYKKIRNQKNINNREILQNNSIKKTLYNIITNVDGFFNVSEFRTFFSKEDFLRVVNSLNEQLFKIESQKIEFNLEEVFNELCEKLYDELYVSIKNKLNINNRKFKIDLRNSTVAEKELLTQCLKVNSGKSLTGIIKSVKIKDNISNEYAILLKKLKISQLTILDTYGLDHVKWNEGIEEVLKDIYYQYKDDKSILLDDLAVLYVKKLDSGRPNELKYILPAIYSTIPQAPVYCVFSGIDIFYSDNENWISKLNWDEKEIFNYPKSVQYILSNTGKNEIIKNIKCSNDRKQNLYLVLKNNLVAYCGKKQLVKSKYTYYKNNIKQIEKILKSVIMKEFSSLEIVNIEEVANILNKKNVRKEIIILLAKIFEKASVTTWENYHWKTTETNYNKIIIHKELGFWGVNHQRWYQLFREAFNDVMTQETSRFLNEFKHGKDAIEAALVNMEIKFLGNVDNLYYVNLEEDKKNGFRKILEAMYKQPSIYKYNPFDLELSNKMFTGDYKGKRYVLTDFLDDVVDFLKGFNNNEAIRNDLVVFFNESLLSQIKQDNELKSYNIINLNTKLSDALKIMEEEFIMKYDSKNYNKEEKTIIKFNKLLQYYFTQKEKQ